MAGKRDCSHLDDQQSKNAKYDLTIHENKNFPAVYYSTLNPVCEDFLEVEYKLAAYIDLQIAFKPPVAYIYNPLQYAQEVHCNFVRKYCTSKKNLLLVGMNPGPWGMCQTGVPFGQVDFVKDWLKVTGNIQKPIVEHPSRLIQGFACTRSEVSGNRLWSLFQELSGNNPEALFEDIFLHNYCPFAFLSTTGKNITPPQIKVAERKRLEDLCDEALIEVARILSVKHLVCIGNYVTERAKKALARSPIENIQVVTLMHPSPINPAANKGWADIAKRQLTEAGIMHYFTNSQK